MKTLRESLFDQDVQDISTDDIETAAAVSWINKNYKIKGSYTIHDKYIDVKGSVILTDRSVDRLLPEGWRFGEVTGDFICSNSEIKSLEGSPVTCDLFECCKCPNLTSLKGSPNEIFDRLVCNDCPNIKTLEGAGTVSILECINCGLVSLKGSPEYLYSLYCSRNANLKTLAGGPVTLDDTFDCSSCKSLKNLKGSPTKIGSMATFTCYNCTGLETLEGAPEEVMVFSCERCSNLKNFKGAPKKCSYFVCDFCDGLQSIEGIPEIITDQIDAKHIKLSISDQIKSYAYAKKINKIRV